MYPFRLRTEGISHRTRDLLIIIICLLIGLNVLQYILSGNASIKDEELRSVFVAYGRSDMEKAQAIATQLSRTGGTTTQRYLSQMRQYLYGIAQLNTLTSAVFGGGQALVPQDMVDRALSAVEACEMRLQEGLALDAQLSDLGQALGEISQVIAAL